MIKRIRSRLEHLRTQPDSVRVRAATMFALGGSVLFALAWVAVLLPIQLRGLDGDATESEAILGGVGGAQDVVELPTPKPQNDDKPVLELHDTRPTVRGPGEAPQLQPSPTPSPETEIDSATTEESQLDLTE